MPEPKPAARPEPEIPDWLKETPMETTYDLTMFDDGGGGVQQIALSRAEFIALKRHLAQMRGYPAA